MQLLFLKHNNQRLLCLIPFQMQKKTDKNNNNKNFFFIIIYHNFENYFALAIKINTLQLLTNIYTHIYKY